MEAPARPQRWARRLSAGGPSGEPCGAAASYGAEHSEEAEEARRLAALFALFDRHGSGSLGLEELQFAAEYFGLRAGNESSPTTLGDGVSAADFARWARAAGGSRPLLARRRRAVAEAEGVDGQGELADSASDRAVASSSHGSSTGGAACELGEELFSSPGAIPLGPAELRAVSGLTPCQLRALRHIRALARRNHERALPEVEARARGLGFKERHVWMALAWVRELAPIVVHVNLDKALDFLESDDYYRSQFETGTSGGLLNSHTRDAWERDLFGGAYDGCAPFERVKYGVLNVFNDPRGYVRLKNFGDSYLVLRNVRLRCTLSPEDSGEVAGGKNLKPRDAAAAERLAVPDLYAHVLLEYSDEELGEALRAANSRDVHCGDTGRIMRPHKYKEVQIHGELRLCRDISRLVANERHWPLQGRLERLCGRHGWTLGWMDTERSHIEGSRRPECRRPSARWKTQPA